MSYRLINANSIVFNSDGFITAENIEKMPCIYADLPNGMDGEHYVLEQEPKTGHWIWQTEDIYRCSECGNDIRVEEVMNIPQYVRCPLCEAKMVEPQERSEE